MRAIFIAGMLMASLGFETASAASVTKCIDGQGKVTFVQHDCPAGTSSNSELSVESQRPSGSGPAVKIAKPDTSPRVPRKKRTYNHCGELTQVDIAYATSHGNVQIGMTGQDVRDIWGSPSSINETADGQQWVYPIDEYRNRYLYVDNRGCFTYWN